MTATEYERSGVRGQSGVISAVRRLLGPTLELPDAEVVTGFGHYASVIKLDERLAIGICTDGVGSKTVVASTLDRYDTIGYDCVAMNVNDLLCVGARPVAMVDYLGVHALDDRRAAQILEGLAGAAREARIAIPGGEVAQLPEVIGSAGGGERAFDLVGTAVGVLDPGSIISGERIAPGDAILGLASSGVHSNGLSLARRALVGSGAYGLHDDVPALGRTLGEELLEPTLIYVRAIRALWDAGIDTRGICHITGDGFANLCRLDADVSYDIEELPPPPPIFALIQQGGKVPDPEMYAVFNMGVGAVVIVPEDHSERSLAAVRAQGYGISRIGTVAPGPRAVAIRNAGLVGRLVDGEAGFREATAGSIRPSG